MHSHSQSCTEDICARKVPIFENLSDEELLEIMKIISHKKYLKDDIIFTEGDTASTLYFVNEGKIKLYKYTKDGKEQILNVLSEGDFFGELDLLKVSNYGFSSKAMVNSKICTITKSKMKDIIMRKPEIAVKLLEALAERLSKAENLVQSLATNDVDSRMAYLLVNLIERYGRQIENNILIKLPISREDMGSFIGVTRETISRKLKKFEDEKLIKIVGTRNIIILDKEGLKRHM